jgi:protein tyrosine/serine phosphatase
MRELKGFNKPKIFIGNLKDTFNKEELDKHNINIVMNVCNDIDSCYFSDIVYLKWGLDDPKEGLAHSNDVVYAAMLLYMAVNSPARMGGNILIHCAAGHNRSPLVVACWLNKYKRIKLNKAIQLAEVADQKNWMIDKGFTWQ